VRHFHSALPSFLATFACLLSAGPPALARGAPTVGHPVGIGADVDRSGIDRDAIEWVVEREIDGGRIPGAVVLIGDRDRVLYRRAFGRRAVRPQPEAMTENTVFDLASLTKVVATTTAVLQLAEQGQLRLDNPVSQYWPDFAAHGKAQVTVRELLTHTSGLPADLDLAKQWLGRTTALHLVAAQSPLAPADFRYIYSDINFIALGEVVERVSGLTLDQYCSRYIFRPLGMLETSFKPTQSERARIAPTSFEHGRFLRGEVHDPTARRMGGIAGHAGLFSTADDLARFAQELLRDAAGASRRPLLRPETIALMRRPHWVAPNAARGLGWDLAAPFVANRDAVPPFGAFGHTGYTGTSLWVDPVSGLFLIILSNRVHPDGGGDARPLRSALAELLSTSLTASAANQARDIREVDEDEEGSNRTVASSAKLESGADVLVADDFAPLKGLRIGLITNQTGRTADGTRTLEVLRKAPEVHLVALFSPEHGLDGLVDDRVRDSTDATTGLHVYSLYGAVKRPTDAMLEGLDALVFDIQDSGTRFYTYITTMAYAMEAAARNGLTFFVIDRPDPISAGIVQGPLLDDDLRSFTGYFPLPLRHGMTVGELARLFNSEARIGARLQVIAMRGYRRGAWFDETGLPWVPPSPNLRTLKEAALYPAVGMLEGANVSVGRGTQTPFQIIGAPWIDGWSLAGYLARRDIPGVRFAPARFVPQASEFKDRACSGVRVLLVDRGALDAGRLGVEIESALYHLYPKVFEIGRTTSLVGSRAVVQAIEAGEDPASIARSWQGQVQSFLSLRSRYLLYPEADSRSLRVRGERPFDIPLLERLRVSGAMTIRLRNK
jgi:uncharacterized protein YbbC (DUF1343 family)/CubicO group peptidase (beta-lactamase class C family)